MSHHNLQRRIDTPLGPLTAARSAAGLSGLWFDGQKHHPGPLQVPEDDGSDPVLSASRSVRHCIDQRPLPSAS